MQVLEVMTKHVYACFPGDSLREAARIMGELDCGAVPVLNERLELVGVVTDRDICLYAADRGKSLDSLRVADAVTRQPVTCTPDEEIDSVESKLSEHQVRRLPVTDDIGRLLGILSLGDIAAAQADVGSVGGQRKLAVTIAAISRPTIGFGESLVGIAADPR
jgi:CBS domain-containing protein